MAAGRQSIPERIAFIGFGEAAQAMTKGWRTAVHVSVSAYDIKTDDPVAQAAKLDDYKRLDVRPCESAAQAVAGADVVFSAVTAGAVLDAARSALPALKKGQPYLDINSASPKRKRLADDMVGDCGALYTDVAVMMPVREKLHRTPLLIAGPGAKAAEDLLRRLRMNFETISDRTGDASTIKMVRSVMIKGLESLTAECVLAAVQTGIHERILDSLEESFPGMEWRQRAGVMLGRMIEHGRRRAEEMLEVAATLDDLGLGGTMAMATARRQAWVAGLDAGRDFGGALPDDYLVLAKALLERQKGGA